MDAACSSIYGSGENQHLGLSVLVLPSPQETLPKYSDFQQYYVNQAVNNGFLAKHTNSLPSNSGAVSHIVSSPSGFSMNLHFSSAAASEKQTGNSLRTNNLPCCPDSLQCFLDFPAHVDENQLQNTCNDTAPAVLVKQSNLQEWAEHLIGDDDALTTNWSDLLVNDTVESLETEEQKLSSGVHIQQQQPQVQLQAQPHLHPASSCETGVNATPSSSNSAAKQRMRWNPELHEAFVEAVNKLGGNEKATPKGILKLMKVEGLTIYQVKSHLQKYRTARYRPDPSEVTSQRNVTSIEKISSLDLKNGIEITEALRLQVEVQKRLHEQLEIQRNLQLRIEEHGRYLQMMIEKQCKSVPDSDKLNASSLCLENMSIAYALESPGKRKAEEIFELDASNLDNGMVDSIADSFNVSSNIVGEKWRAPETEEALENFELNYVSQSQSKRAKNNEQGFN